VLAACSGNYRGSYSHECEQGWASVDEGGQATVAAAATAIAATATERRQQLRCHHQQLQLQT